MGFSVSGAAAIIFVSLFFAFSMWYTAADNSFQRVVDAQDTQTDSSLSAANTDVEIVNTTYSGGELTIEVNNTGATALGLNSTDLLLDSEYEQDWQADATVAGNGTTDLWLPGEQLEITISGLSERPARVKIATETGVTAATEVN